ncbi:MAG: DNA photolyase family protein, partial [Pseudomonadota bacterium]|nr:DNA photolyase family protein [Pseudomonadota bacterium]
MSKQYDKGLMWFRRDLRCDDNAALHHALKACCQVFCLFVLDRDILDQLPRADRRVEFIRESLLDLDGQLRQLASQHGIDGAGLVTLHGWATEAVPRLARALGVSAVFANRDDEPQSLRRDRQVADALAASTVAFHTFKDHVIFERQELLTQTGKPYSVFTPYKNAWLKKVDAFFLRPYAIENHAATLAPRPAAWRAAVPELTALNFEPTNLVALKIPTGSAGGAQLLDQFIGRIDQYHATRDFPAVKGPSYLGVHLRFGTISVRRLAALARERIASAGAHGSRGATVWLSELIWRDFYQQVLHHQPHVVGASCNPAFDRVRFEHGRQADEAFAAWCEARTGFPIVDAAMLQLQQTGWMHNRLRMVAASFLVKDLGLDWRRGEAHFALHLVDYELASNNGGWQWVASTGGDAQPWFRIFNPVTQSRRFDPDGKFIARYLP